MPKNTDLLPSTFEPDHEYASLKPHQVNEMRAKLRAILDERWTKT